MWIFIAIVAAAAVYIAVTYNSFVSLQNRAQNAWVDIDVQLKRRHDLIPNLVETVKGYASHEKSVFEDVARLRSQASQVQGMEGRGGTEAELTGVIKTLFAISESYPDLKADKNFRELQTQLAEIEEHISCARWYYNAVVRDLNTKRQMFPSNIIGNLFGVKDFSYFQVDDEAREPVAVNMVL